MGLHLLWVAQTVFFLIFLGVLFGVGLAPGVERLKQMGVPRGLGVVAIMTSILGALAVTAVLMAPTVREQGERLRADVPRALEELGTWLDEGGPGIRQMFRESLRNAGDDDEARDEVAGEEGAEPPREADRGEAGQDTVDIADTVEEEEPTAEIIRGRLTEQLEGLGQHFVRLINSTTSILAWILLTFFIAIYFSVSSKTYQRGFLLLVPRHQRGVVEETMGEAALMLRRWLLTQFVTMVLIGVLTTLMLMLFDVPAALALGILAGLLEFIPIAGPIIASIPAIAMAFLVSPQTGLYVAIAYLAIQQLESQILVPLMLKNGIDLPPLLTVSIQAFMVIVFGFVGLLVAVPLVATAVVVVKVLYVRDRLGYEVRLPSDVPSSI